MNPSCDAAESSALLTLEQALEQLCARIEPLAERERVAVTARDAPGRVLAEDLLSPIASPPFDNSAMDGYALRSADTLAPGGVRLRVVGTAWAGRPYDGRVGPGECVRIFTGAVMPSGTDTVVIQEAVTASDIEIGVPSPVARGQWVRAAGRDLAAGQRALPTGRRLSPIDVGLIAAMGLPEISVVRPARVGLLSTGDELTPPGTPLQPGAIYDSNRVATMSLLRPLAVRLTDLGAYPDDPEILKRTLHEAASWNDVIVTIGGASVGAADHIVPVLREIGRVELWKIAVKPGKPFLYGRIDQCHLFGLPGNPASALVTCLQLVRPALLRLMGAQPEPPVRVSAICEHQLTKATDRMEFQRGVYRGQPDGTLSVSAVAGQDADRLAAFSSANCFIVLPAASRGAAAGEPVVIEPFSSYG